MTVIETLLTWRNDNAPRAIEFVNDSRLRLRPIRGDGCGRESPLPIRVRAPI